MGLEVVPPSEQDWQVYDSVGYLRLGEIISGDELLQLRARVDDLALGRVLNDAIRVQRDTGGEYDALPDVIEQSRNSTLCYRKVQGLETDSVFGPLVHYSLFRDIAAHHYGPHASISIFRAMVMNKPAYQGTILPWHQDGGDVWALDRDPLVTIWVALDDARVASGCLEVVPGSHRLGLLSSFGSTLASADVTRHCSTETVVPLEVPAGHGLLMHNWLVHRSGVNRTGDPRRAFTACYMDGRTRSSLTGDLFPMAFGTPPAEPSFLSYAKSERAALTTAFRSAEEFAWSLQAENELLHRSLDGAAVYARSLEDEIAKLQMRG